MTQIFPSLNGPTVSHNLINMPLKPLNSRLIDLMRSDLFISVETYSCAEEFWLSRGLSCWMIKAFQSIM